MNTFSLGGIWRVGGDTTETGRCGVLKSASTSSNRPAPSIWLRIPVGKASWFGEAGSGHPVFAAAEHWRG
ncbi:hypothetical protein QFZ91_007395 [Paraburkholderia sp. JPY419]